jgi:hypothetical protein
MQSIIYKGHEIECHAGWYSCFMLGVGYLRADSLRGIKELVREAKGGHVK